MHPFFLLIVGKFIKILILQIYLKNNMREFNVTGICVPEMHYMVDISENQMDRIGRQAHFRRGASGWERRE